MLQGHNIVLLLHIVPCLRKNHISINDSISFNKTLTLWLTHSFTVHTNPRFDDISIIVSLVGREQLVV